MSSVELHGDDYARGARHDFAVNVVTDPWPSWLEDAIARGTRQLGRYPDGRAAAAALASRHRREPEQVVVLAGAAEAFTLLARTVNPERPLVVHPSFTEPERALRAAGLDPERLILAPPFELDPEAVPPDADLVIVGNPTNPTGVLHPQDALRRLCRPGRITVIDEAFMEFVPRERESLAGAAELPGLVVVRSLTKALGVPGVRAGYLLAPVPLAAQLRDSAPSWPVNAVALAILEDAADRSAYFDLLAQQTAARRAELVAALDDIEAIHTHPATANFVLLELADAISVHRRLLAEHDVATRPGWTFPGLDQRHLRVVVRGSPRDRKLTTALAATVSDAELSPARGCEAR